ncbi:MAG: radical SAM protein, partial [Clostridia bacterium]|nr:radical SAM protein [Clostridia bacterium]
MEKLQKLVLCTDLAGCPNRCRHCWIGHSPNPNLTPDDLRTMAAAFRPYTEKLGIYDWYREPDYRDDYRELWQLCNELSDEPRDHFELMSVWRAVRDPEYVPWLASLGLRRMQLTLFGDRETTDRYTGRKGAYDDILAVIEQLIAHKISPRIQYFAYRDNIDQLSHLEALIDRLQLAERCKDFTEPFNCFVHGGSVAGEA